MGRTARVFISYARADQSRVEPLFQSLKAAGFDPWMDRHNLTGGDEWPAEIRRAIDRSGFFLACVSEASFHASGTLRDEIQRALSLWRRKWWLRWPGLFLIPVRLEPCPIPSSLSHLQWVDMFQDAAWVNIAAAIRTRRRRMTAYVLSTSAAIVLLFSAAAALWPGDATADLIDRFRNPGGEARVGVTVWRMRPAEAAPVSTAFVKEKACGTGTVQRDWQPVRAPAEAVFHRGDRLRVSIESGLDGYLYVIDQEIQAGGLGPPKLIFPTSRIRAGDNRVRRGSFIEIPDQQDCPPYWTIEANGSSYGGESLLVLIVPRAIRDRAVTRDAQVLDPAVLDTWRKRWSAPLVVEQNANAVGTVASAAEIEAGRGAKMLTHRDPLPQTVYQAKAKVNAILAGMRLAVDASH